MHRRMLSQPTVLAVAQRCAPLWADPTLRATLLLTINNLVTGLGGMAFWMLVACRYTPAVVGAATAGTALVIFLAGASQLGLGIGLVRYGRALGPQRRRRLAGMFGAVALTALAIGWAYVTFVPRIHPQAGTAATPADAVVLIAACSAWALSVQYDSYLISRRRGALLVAKSLLTSLLRIGLVLLWREAQPAQIVGITGASGLVGMLMIALPVAGLRGAPVLTAEPTVAMGRFIRFSLWNYLGGLAGTMPALLLPTIVVARLGAAPAAAAYMAWALFGVLLFVPSALGWALLSGAAPGAGGPPPPNVWLGRLMVAAPILFLPVAWLILIALGPSYGRDGGPVLVLLGSGYWAYCRVQTLTARLRVCGAQWRLTLATTASQAAIILGSFPLLGLVGVAGGALAWSLGQWLLALLLQAQLPASDSERAAPESRGP